MAPPPSTTSHHPIPSPAVVSPDERAALLGQQPFVLWFTGLSGAGKTTLANYLARLFHDCGLLTYVIDGDLLRHNLNRDLSFSDADRRENIRRLAHLAALMYEAGLITLVACISPFHSDRAFARSLLPAGRFIEIFVDTPLPLCEARDPKGLYRRARQGIISQFTGIDSPYERPSHPDITIDTTDRTVADCAAQLLAHLRQHKLLQWPVPD